MPSLNKAILIGNICQDPELKQTPTGVNVTTFSIAVQRKYKDAGGEYPTDFLSIVAWRGTAEFVCRNFRKGDPIVICGSIEVRSYQDKDGNRRYATEILAEEAGFCGKRSSERPPMPGDEEDPLGGIG